MRHRRGVLEVENAELVLRLRVKAAFAPRRGPELAHELRLVEPPRQHQPLGPRVEDL